MKNLLVFGILAIVIWLMVHFPHAMISPGELVEGHKDLNEKCLSCHEPFWGISNNKCISCHKLSEIGKDTLNVDDSNAAITKILFHHQLADQKCTMCHMDHKGVAPDASLNTFKHELLSETIINNCAGCHGRPSDKLHAQLSSSCNNCHNTSGWKSAVRFNHNLIQGTDINNCVSCHQKPNDSYHHLFKDNCNKCHNTSKWVPSTFDHSTYFRLDRNHNAKCSVCHMNNNFSAYTCYGCHEHSRNNIMAEHNEEGIFNVENCVSCHKSGSEHDMEGGGRLNNESDRHETGKAPKRDEKNERGHEKEDDDD